LVIQAANNLSDERAEFLMNDRLSFMRFLGHDLAVSGKALVFNIQRLSFLNRGAAA
jgi:hypothetical protein